MKTFQVGNLIVETISRRNIASGFDEINTGESNGSGEFTVYASAVIRLNPTQFKFTGVVIEAEGDYETWSQESLEENASQLLAADYL